MIGDRRISWRDIVLEMLGDKCASCGTTEQYLHIDHIVPLGKGGKHEFANLQALCKPCHAKKTTEDGYVNLTKYLLATGPRSFVTEAESTPVDKPQDVSHTTKGLPIWYLTHVIIPEGQKP